MGFFGASCYIHDALSELVKIAGAAGCLLLGSVWRLTRSFAPQLEHRKFESSVIGRLRWSGIYLSRFSKVLPAKAIPTKMIPASASVRIELRAIPKPKWATISNMIAVITAVTNT
jgi:hypothetical protein